MIRKYRYLLTAAAAVGAAGLLTFAARNDFGLGRNMEIAVNMMRELSLNYVDPVDPDRLMEGAAAGMVSDLDPYTEYIPEEGMQDFELLTTGKYGGIGSLIRQKDDYVRIAQPYQGSPADKAGLKIGDKILSIDGKDAKGFTTEQVSSRLKGEPGSKVKVTVEHLDGTQQTAAIRRERIAIPGVPYAGWVADGIGYIRHSDFTEGCYEEMRAAIERLRTERPLKGLVLDYRSNGGGIMQEAVKILGMFVPKGTEVVSTKGRSEDSKQVFRTDTEPILADLPLTVLINGSSASAAEIVAGALQDLDRAVLIGQRSFGKGLVQSPRPLGYNAMLKLTTAKYYIPSGRCIQAIDYSHSQEGSVRVIPDSLISEFSTKAGRKVYDGVHPDVIYVAPDPDAKVPTIKVDQIRSIAATAYILPSEAEKKVYVLRQADTMNLSAQNAFLKLLEEPPQSAAFILAAASPELLLPTVRSRCALLRDPTEQLQESDEIRTLAEDYLRAVASQDRLTLLRWCLAQEGMDAQTLSAFLPAVQHRLVQLLAEPDETVLPQALCAQQLRLMETCENYRRANVGTKHIFGLLSVSGVQAKVQK